MHTLVNDHHNHGNKCHLQKFPCAPLGCCFCFVSWCFYGKNTELDIYPMDYG